MHMPPQQLWDNNVLHVDYVYHFTYVATPSTHYPRAVNHSPTLQYRRITIVPTVLLLHHLY